MKQYKILHICTGYDLDFNGGITNYVRSIAKTQSDMGWEVYVLSDSGISDGYSVIKYKSKIDKWAFVKKSDAKSLKIISVLIEEKDFDLIHIHMVLNIDQTLYKVLEGRKYVVSLHDYYYLCPRIQMMPPGGGRCATAKFEKCERCFSILEKNNLISRFSRKVFGIEASHRFPIKSRKVYNVWYQNNKRLLEGAQLLLPVSNRVKEIYLKSGIQNDYTVLHIGNISALSFNQNLNKNLNSDQINMVILSSISRSKGGPLFFSILKRINNPKIKVHFYGRCSDAESKIMDSLGIINHGPYKQDNLSNILSDMDMGIMTPIWEDNGPQVVMEMLNNGLPVFATKMGGITDFVDNTNGFVFDPYDENDINKACAFLNSLDRNKVTLLKSNIKRTLTPQEHGEELLGVYEKLIEGSRKDKQLKE